MNSKLNTIFAASLATLVAAGGIVATTAQANAGQLDRSNFVGAQTAYLVKTSAGATHEDMSSAVQQSDGVGISVRTSQEMSKSERYQLKAMKTDEPQRVAALQSSIRSNKALMSALAKRNVDVGNVIDVRHASDGGLIFYEL